MQAMAPAGYCEIAERVIAHKPEGVEASYDRYEYLG
jgi:hypothetical protein